MGLLRVNGPNGKRLRSLSSEVTDPSIEVEPYVEEAYRVMSRESGIGIAAPQIAVFYRWYVTPTMGIVINPTITNKENSVSIIEGCVSIPGKWFETTRYKNITLEYYDIEMNHNVKEYEDYESFVVQHEVDHLDGILISDHGERKYSGE